MGLLNCYTWALMYYYNVRTDQKTFAQALAIAYIALIARPVI
jgi:hypothetical protein